jgi:hypothetical protein
MHKSAMLKTVPFALALGASALAGVVSAPASSAAVRPVAQAAMKVSEMGKIVKITSATSFKMSTAMHHYTVKTNAMTHVTLDKMKAKVSALKKGDSVTVTGALEMGTIIATSVKAGM